MALDIGGYLDSGGGFGSDYSFSPSYSGSYIDTSNTDTSQSSGSESFLDKASKFIKDNNLSDLGTKLGTIYSGYQNNQNNLKNDQYISPYNTQINGLAGQLIDQRNKNMPFLDQALQRSQNLLQAMTQENNPMRQRLMDEYTSGQRGSFLQGVRDTVEANRRNMAMGRGSIFDPERMNDQLAYAQGKNNLEIQKTARQAALDQINQKYNANMNLISNSSQYLPSLSEPINAYGKLAQSDIERQGNITKAQNTQNTQNGGFLGSALGAIGPIANLISLF